MNSKEIQSVIDFTSLLVIVKITRKTDRNYPYSILKLGFNTIILVFNQVKVLITLTSYFCREISLERQKIEICAEYELKRRFSVKQETKIRFS